jgi:hypothetical protein
MEEGRFGQRARVGDAVTFENHGEPARVRLQGAGHDGDRRGRHAFVESAEDLAGDPLELVHGTAANRQHPHGLPTLSSVGGELGMHRSRDRPELERPGPSSADLLRVWVPRVVLEELYRNDLRERLQQVALGADELRRSVHLHPCQRETACPCRGPLSGLAAESDAVEECVFPSQLLERVPHPPVELAKRPLGVGEMVGQDAGITEVA